MTGKQSTPLARLLAGSKMRAEVNIGKIDKLTKEGDTVAVPGKVLGNGSLTHSVNVAANSFSKSAAEKIKGAGGKALALKELKETKNVRLIA